MSITSITSGVTSPLLITQSLRLINHRGESSLAPPKRSDRSVVTEQATVAANNANNNAT